MDYTTDRLTAAVSKITGGVLLGNHIVAPGWEPHVKELAEGFSRFVRPELCLEPIGYPYMRVGHDNEAEYQMVEMRHRPRSFAYVRFLFRITGRPWREETLMQAIDGARSVHTTLVDWGTPEGIQRFWETYARLVLLTRMDLWKEAIGGRLPENVTQPKP